MDDRLKNLLLLVIVDVIVLALVPSVAQAVGGAQNSASITGSNDTLIGLITLIFVVCIAGVNIATLYKMFSG
jgi:hypothetical protein